MANTYYNHAITNTTYYGTHFMLLSLRIYHGKVILIKPSNKNKVPCMVLNFKNGEGSPYYYLVFFRNLLL